MNQINPINVNGFQLQEELILNPYLDDNIVDECINVLSHAIDILNDIQCANIH